MLLKLGYSRHGQEQFAISCHFGKLATSSVPRAGTHRFSDRVCLSLVWLPGGFQFQHLRMSGKGLHSVQNVLLSKTAAIHYDHILVALIWTSDFCVGLLTIPCSSLPRRRQQRLFLVNRIPESGAFSVNGSFDRRLL